jgi:oxygen-independent coproporphyrinogen-3 oxidase
MTKQDLDDDIELSLKLKSKHLSYYSLQIEKGTMFYNKHIKAQDDEVMREMYDYLIKKLHEAGFKRYEVSNFAIPGYESRHNLTYWHDEPYYAVGLSASGYINQTRFTNTHSMTKYMKGLTDWATEEISSKSEEFEFLMLNLRLVSGYSLDKFKERFHKDFLVSYQKEIKKVEEYVQVKDGYFAIKPEYLYTMDHILLELLK